MKHWVSAKLHGISVTDKSVEYNGSVTICSELMKKAGIENHEKVQIVNLNNGNRWETYALAGESGVFSLNGGGARLGEVGDKCVIIAYRTRSAFLDFDVVFCGKDNFITHFIRYENT